MILFPAIDLKDGQCVRLIKGEMDAATVFNDNPAQQAQDFEAQGFKWLHLVDLNGAFAGNPVNADAVKAIRSAIDLPIQLGGGIRTMEMIETWLDIGITRVILGTVALKDPDLVKEAAKKYPGQIVVGIDAKDGRVAVNGWAETAEIGTITLARKFEDAGVAAIIYTDIDRDGILTGLNFPATLDLAQSVSIPVIASGGLSSIEDIKTMITPPYTIFEGAISGRALYDGRIDPEEALALLRSPEG